MVISRSNIPHQVSKPPRNKVASRLKDPRYRQRIVESKKTYNRKKTKTLSTKTPGV